MFSMLYAKRVKAILAAHFCLSLEFFPTTENEARYIAQVSNAIGCLMCAIVYDIRDFTCGQCYKHTHGKSRKVAVDCSDVDIQIFCYHN